MVLYRGSVRHASANAQYLPGVCAEPSLQSAAVDRVQTESILHSSAGPTRKQADMSGPVSRDISYLPDAPGTAPTTILFHLSAFLILLNQLKIIFLRSAPLFHLFFSHFLSHILRTISYQLEDLFEVFFSRPDDLGVRLIGIKESDVQPRGKFVTDFGNYV